MFATLIHWIVGHSSISFCGLTFLTLFLLNVTSRVNFRHHNTGKAIRFFIVLVPLFSAALVASSRVIDYKHHVEDTIWGSLIGATGAYLAFNANYGYSYIARDDPQGITIVKPRNYGADGASNDVVPVDDAEARHYE